MKEKVLLGMSGGVDSSVAAAILIDEGYEVLGLHFSLTGEKEDLSDVKAVAEKLNIPLTVKDFSSVFKREVFDPFISSYKSGKTPNICVECNKHIKFGEAFLVADELKCDFVATGHYCEIIDLYGRFYLKKGTDKDKDQSYFLNGVTEEKLKRVLFPLAKLKKEEVREIAEKRGLKTAHKKGSSDVCLAGERNFKDFLRDYIPPNPGKIISETGEVVGKHDGLFSYTLGQRKGLNLGGKKGEEGGRWFVVDKKSDENVLVVSHGSEDSLFTGTVFVEDFCFINGFPSEKSFRCTAKTRYREPDTPATVFVDGNKVKVVFDEQRRAVTPGQYCVLYRSGGELSGTVIGGGKIV